MGDVGQEIRRLREAKGWSQPKLAVEAGVAVSGVSQIENGRRNPNSSTLVKLANALDVDVADFFPKAEAPLWSDEPPTEGPTFNFREARDHLEEYCERWDHLIANGRLDSRHVEEFFVTGEGWIPVLDIALRAELDELRQATGLRGSALLARSEIAQANERYLGVFSELGRVLSRISNSLGEHTSADTNVVRLEEYRERLAGMQREAVG